ncbi:MAG TPA: PfkB family carbohydrate kinase [Acidobacteriaceae bacterium]|nr:PfkB family carbohydrate kinase [Acidobacteriaceae bacterium]
MKTFDVTIAGEINLDLILYGLPREMPVERELLATGFQPTLGSSSAILAHNLAVLGSRVGFITCTGKDNLGKMALDQLSASGVDLTRALTHDSITTGVTILLPHDESRHILTYLGTIAALKFCDLDLDYLASSRHFHLSSLYLQSGLVPDLPKLFRELKAAGLTISLDTNDDPAGKWGPPLDSLLPFIDVFLPNESELLRMTKTRDLDSALALLSPRVPCIAVKRGRLGSVVKTQEGLFSAPPVLVNPVDTVGAGDSFNAGFLFAWLLGLSPEECGRAGNITGALSTLRPGGTEAFRDAALLSTFLSEHNFPQTTATKDHAMTQASDQDKFVAMVTATAEISLPLGRFQPVSTLVSKAHCPLRPRFPAIDYHNHLDALNPADVLRVMDSCGIEHVVNITMKTGDDALRMIDKFHSADPNRFSTIGWMDWSDVTSPEFVARTLDRLDRLVAHGAKGIKFWKDFGLSVRDTSGRLLSIDDERFAPIFDKAAELHIPVMFHTADPDAFFLPLDERNERYEELAAHPDWSFAGSPVPKSELLDQRDRVFARHPDTTFVAAHVAESGENLARATKMLETHPNVSIDISARASELGRQPYSARKLFLRFPDRILFGTDLLPEDSMYRLYFRFLETADEYFEYPSHASRQGRWNIYGLFLPDDILRKVYRDNALKLLRL